MERNINEIRIKGKNIHISVSVFLFKEDGVHIAYCPSLDLSGYDSTEALAKKDFEYMLNDYLRTQSANGTLMSDLSRHGWHIGNEGGKEPNLADLLCRGEAAKVAALPEFRKTNVASELIEA